jgi:hypothetical protein
MYTVTARESANPKQANETTTARLLRLLVCPSTCPVACDLLPATASVGPQQPSPRPLVIRPPGRA